MAWLITKIGISFAIIGSIFMMLSMYVDSIISAIYSVPTQPNLLLFVSISIAFYVAAVLFIAIGAMIGLWSD